MFLVDVDDLLYLIIAAEEDAAPVMDVLGHDFNHALHLAVDCLAAGCVHVSKQFKAHRWAKDG